MKISSVLLIIVFSFTTNIFSQVQFASHTIVGGEHAADDAKSVYAVDVDGDGDMDVLSASSLDDKIASISILAISADERISPPKKSTTISLSSLPISVSDNSIVKKTSSTIKAVLLRSWLASTELIWQYINENWWKYGSTEVNIDYTSLSFVSPITLQALINSEADVIILSDPAGANLQYTQSEFQALSDYCSTGHNLIGTYLLLQNYTIDNRFLAPLWGLNDTTQWIRDSTSAIYYYQDPTNYLFTNINEPYISGGFPHSTIPAVGNWITSGLNGAQVVGLTQDTSAVITQYDAGNFWSIYISNMPEYQGDSIDAQFLYNAITFNDQFTSIDKDEVPIPHSYFLGQNFPNPFNPTTHINYSIPTEGVVIIKVYDVLGNEITTLINEEKPAGSYEVEFSAKDAARNLSSGIYFYILQAGRFVETKKMVLLR